MKHGSKVPQRGGKCAKEILDIMEIEKSTGFCCYNCKEKGGFDRGDSGTAFGVLFGWDSNLLIMCPACPQRSFSRYTLR